MTTAVVILNWNGRKMMERYLPNVKQHTAAEASIIVADNASTDDSKATTKHSPTWMLTTTCCSTATLM